jgi:hypothetical protein
MEMKMSSTDKTHPGNGQVALVITGAGRGIGAAIAHELSRSGRHGRTFCADARSRPLSNRLRQAIAPERAGSAEVVPLRRDSSLQSVEAAAKTRRSLRWDASTSWSTTRASADSSGPLHQLAPDVLGADPEHEPARRLLCMTRAFASDDDSRALRPHHQHFVSRRKESRCRTAQPTPPPNGD